METITIDTNCYSIAHLLWAFNKSGIVHFAIIQEEGNLKVRVSEDELKRVLFGNNNYKVYTREDSDIKDEELHVYLKVQDKICHDVQHEVFEWIDTLPMKKDITSDMCVPLMKNINKSIIDGLRSTLGEYYETRTD